MAQPLDLGSPAVLKDLNAKLLSQPYVSGFVASSDDVAVFAGMPEAPSAELPNLKRWHAHITALLLKSFPVRGNILRSTHSMRAPLPLLLFPYSLSRAHLFTTATYSFFTLRPTSWFYWQFAARLFFIPC